MVGSKTVVGNAPQAAPASQPPRSGRSARLLVRLDVAQHVLRFWESKFPQVRPLKRGGGRRYYRPEDVDLLRQIRSLLYEEGYTIKGARSCSRPAARRANRRRGGGGAPCGACGHRRPRPELVPEEVRHQLIEHARSSWPCGTPCAKSPAEHCRGCAPIL